MEKNVIHKESYDFLVQRISKLNKDCLRLFGTMCVEQMICHLSDQLRLALNQKPSITKSNLFDRTIYKFVAIYVMKEMPNGLMTIKEMNQGAGYAGTKPTNLEQDRATLLLLLHDFRIEKNLGIHPLLGRLSSNEWGKLIFVHIDYHLKQFSN